MLTGRELVDRSHRLRNAIAARVDREHAPGLVTVLGTMEDEKFEAVGSKESPSRGPMTSDTIFRIASLTKSFVAATAMSLVESGTIELDQPIERYLPELADRRVLKTTDGPLDDTVPANRSITVRDLLTCRMGFGILCGVRQGSMQRRGPIVRANCPHDCPCDPPNSAS